MPPTSYLTTQEFLMRHGVEPRIAHNVAMNELRHWEINDLAAIFKQIERKPQRFCPFNNVSEFVRREERKTKPRWHGQANAENPVATYLLKTWPSVFSGQDVWYSPPRELMIQAVESKGALCINTGGEWSVQTSGYVALSHVWAEGLQRDDEHGGVDRRRIDLIFQTLQSQNVHATWLWIDVLAIPGGGKRQLSVEDDLLKISIINTLSDIYRNADSVVIFDALAWHLQTSDPVSLAVILVCGLWSSRLWTLQEVKLARKALVLTGARQAVTWASIREKLGALRESNKDRYYKLWLWFSVTGISEEVGVSLPDMIMASFLRQTGNNIDYARAFFPIMGLKWKPHMTLDEGMQELYFSRLYDATRIIFTFGHARLTTRPAWAPRRLTNLQGMIISPLTVESRGVRGSLLCAKVVECTASFTRLGVLAVSFRAENGTFQCKLSADERPTMLAELQQSIQCDTLHVLLPPATNLQSMGEFAQSALLVAKADTRANDGFECSVFCCVMILAAESLAPRTVNMLIRDCDPRDEDLSGAVRYAWHVQESENERRRQGSTSLHHAIQNDPVTTMEEVARKDAEPDSLVDSIASGDLDIAALVENGADINLRSDTAERATAVMLAVKENHIALIDVLGRAGADLEALNEYGQTALMIAALECRIAAAEKLLALGANVNCQQDMSQGSPLLITCTRTNPQQDRLAMVGLLLEAGANVNGGKHPSGWTPLHRAAEWSSDDVVSLLLAYGANVNARELQTLWTPLKYALAKQRTDVVRMLVENGAVCDSIFEGQWTPLHFAASCHDHEMTRILLSKPTPLNVQLAQGGWTALHIAVKSDNMLVVKMLLEAGADATLELGSGEKPAELASSANKEKVTAIVMQNIARREMSKLLSKA